MSKFPVVRDLWVDRSTPLPQPQARQGLGADRRHLLARCAGPKEKPVQQETRYKLSECMSCGCCLEACPQFNVEADEGKWDSRVHRCPRDQPGPALQRARDRQGQLKDERLDALMGPGWHQRLRQRPELRQGLPQGHPADRVDRRLVGMRRSTLSRSSSGANPPFGRCLGGEEVWGLKSPRLPA
jgi:ferredoxin